MFLNYTDQETLNMGVLKVLMCMLQFNAISSESFLPDVS